MTIIVKKLVTKCIFVEKYPFVGSYKDTLISLCGSLSDTVSLVQTGSKPTKIYYPSTVTALFRKKTSNENVPYSLQCQKKERPVCTYESDIKNATKSVNMQKYVVKIPNR